ncbi:MAG: ABC transporter ATP-binding protein [Bdellovibrionales bacterium]|nr:ABC transporter ATP-binding protein [Bdellovibrionales bacterium]
MQEPQEQRPLLRLLQHTKNHRPQLILATLYSILNKVFDIAPEILIGMAIDVVVRGQESFLSQFGIHETWDQILLLGVLTFFIWLGESIFEYLLLIQWRNLAQWIQHGLRCETYNHVQKLDFNFFEDQSSGNLTSILNDDINQLERFLDGGANQMIQTATAVIGVGAVFFYISPQIATFAFLPIPVILIGAFYFQTKATPLYAEVRNKVGLLSSRINNNIAGIQTIKSFTQEYFESHQLRQQSSDYVSSNKKAIAVSSAFIPIIRMAILSGFLATFILGASKVIDGTLNVGAYGVLVFLTQRLLWPLTGMAATVDLYERAMASTRRILNLLNEPIHIKDGQESIDSPLGHFEFKDVNFSYKTGPTILKNIHLEILPHKTTAFVGSTGSGKSTLVKLLLRFYEPNSGDIYLDSKDIKSIDLNSLRKNIGLVSQDVFLFHGTVKENIAYGNPKASEEEIQNAARMAEADEFIQNLPQKYETIIGERGQKLSGGQRQRLSLARALLKNPPILILDEATSAVDNETEAAIQRSLSRVARGRTVIMIAHRLSTIVNADQIYVIERGQVVQQGTHATLIHEMGTYQSLWNVQTGSLPPTERRHETLPNS